MMPVMPQLLELQQAIYRGLVERDDTLAAQYILADGLSPKSRLSIYRNTFIGTLTTALRLSYPAVHRLVGTEFFEGAASLFIAAHPPEGAYLNGYGQKFPDFLASFPPAAALAYLPGVARLEWAVNRALHAPDLPGLDVSRLSAVPPADHERVCFTPHPAVGLVRDSAPADLIWRAVLDQDDGAMAAIELRSGLVCLLVQRSPVGVEVERIDASAWRLAEELFAGHPIATAIAGAPTADAAHLIAAHLAAEHFVDFGLSKPPPLTAAAESYP
jgi:Putative DNA-binding domain